MSMKVVFTILLGLFLITVAFAGLKQQPTRIIPIEKPLILSKSQSQTPCGLDKAGPLAGWVPGWQPGESVITYFDPSECGAPTYPFSINSFEFTLYAPNDDYQWPVTVSIVVYDNNGDSCNGSGQELCRHMVMCGEDVFRSPNVGSYQFPEPCCVEGPFYIGIEYSDNGPGPFPSIGFDGGTADTCNVWQTYESSWYEWCDLSAPPAQHPLYWVHGETVAVNCGASSCAWSPGSPAKMHFPQLPNDNGFILNATAPSFVADDWECSETGMVKDIHWWGSWRSGNEGQIGSFTIYIWSDIPADPPQVPYSHPGTVLWSKTVGIDDLEITLFETGIWEGWYDPSRDPDHIHHNNHNYHYQYDLCLEEQDWFHQDAGTIYWLAIKANVTDPENYKWGWKSTLDHFNDNAVFDATDNQNWREIFEPTREPGRGEFEIWIDAAGAVINSSGFPSYGDQWYYYSTTDAWRMWFYANPYDPDRISAMEFFYMAFPLEGPSSNAEISINWSTDQWSLDQAPNDSMPPLPGQSEPTYIGREIILSPGFSASSDIVYFTLPDYNPEWIGVEVKGNNVMIEGDITSDCRGPMDMAFVITGDPDPIIDEACCMPDGSCIMTDAQSCIDLEGTPQGTGTVCTSVEACCLPDNTCLMLDPLCCVSMDGNPEGPMYSCEGDTCSIRFNMWDTISTSCLNLTVGASGNFARRATEGYTMDYSLSGDCDPEATVYLYDGSPLLLYHDGSELVNYYSMYWNYPFALVKDANLPVPTQTTANYDIYESGTFVTPDLKIGMEKKWWAPKAPDSCSFITQRLRVYSYDGMTHTGVSICEALDWDIPNDHERIPYNVGGYDALHDLIYTRGVDTDDTGCQPNRNRSGGMSMIAFYVNDPATIDTAVDPYSAYVFDNETYLFPYTGFDPTVTDGIIQTPGYGILADSADLNTIMTYFYNYTLNPGDTLNIFTIITTVQNGSPPSASEKSVSDLIANIEKGKKWTSDHVVPLVPPAYLCGDANGDEATNVGDAVFVINNVFKGGPLPDPIEACDSNCDDQCNVGDAVYMINHVFKGGPAPCECK